MKKKEISNNKILQHLKESFLIPTEELEKMIPKFHSEMSKGLSGYNSSLAMIPSFVYMPTGSETGKFIALDLGGTNFRVLEVVLNGKGKVKVSADDKFVLQKEDITGTGKQLFDFIAESIKDFTKVNKIGSNEKRNLGFTFSFPTEQTNIAEGRLLCWNKGFTATNVVGENVVKLLNMALKRKRINNIKVAALLNDTVGTLAAKAYGSKNCDIGVILGTGTNACYPEKISNIKKWRSVKNSSDQMIINIEWGNFDKLSWTSYDKELDKNTENCGRQRLEKMVSGMYLGEIARLIIKDLTKRKMLFKGNLFAAFAKEYGFETRCLSKIKSDKSKNLSNVKALLSKLGVMTSTYKDRRIIKQICNYVVQRSADISATAITAVVLWMDRDISKLHTVAIDGSLFEKMPGYKDRMMCMLKKLLQEKADNIKLVIAKDGSCKGAAIVAATASGN